MRNAVIAGCLVLTLVRAGRFRRECGQSGSTGSIDQDFGGFKLDFVSGYDFRKKIDLGPDATVSIRVSSSRAGSG